MTPGYRPDIDGLRAIAVLSVILFHSGIEGIGGGYVGVDIFFVISGYLITTIIATELAERKFSIVGFYERRCRRIIPALMVVVMFTLLMGYLLMSPRDFLLTGKSAIAAILFYSNILFYWDVGYFATAAEQKALLHTWSLAIEEQYYVIYPLLLILIARFSPRKLAAWLIALCVLSFVAGCIALEYDAEAAFFLSPYRAWELLLGGLLAIRCIPVVKKPLYLESISALGLAMILGSVLLFSPGTPFPGIAALLPTLGTAMIIYAGMIGKTRVSALLGIRPMVFIGLISYSLYLWHWPIIVFTRYYSIVEPGKAVIAVMLLAIFLLSVLSWKFVEEPVRKRKFLPRRPGLFAGAGALALIFVCTGYVVIQAQGFPERHRDLLVSVEAEDDPVWEHWRNCGAVRRLKKQQELCRIGDPNRTSSFLLWGDSHARSLAHAIEIGANAGNKSGEAALKIACPPLLGIERTDGRRCARYNRQIFEYLQGSPDLKTVILVARWPLAANGTRFKSEGGSKVRLMDLQENSERELSNLELLEKGLTRTIDALIGIGKQVILVTSIPEIGYNPISAQYVAQITGREASSIISPKVEDYRSRTSGVRSLFQSYEEAGKVALLDPSKLLCDDSHCKVFDGERLLYRDDDHLSTYGAEYLSGIFVDYFRSI